jgi:hypothetical protein
LVEHRQGVTLLQVEVGAGKIAAGFQYDDVEPALGETGSEHSPARAGADNHDVALQGMGGARCARELAADAEAAIGSGSGGDRLDHIDGWWRGGGHVGSAWSVGAGVGPVGVLRLLGSTLLGLTLLGLKFP